MPRPGRRAQVLSCARESRISTTSGQHGEYGGVFDDSPLNYMRGGKRQRKVKKHFDPSEPPAPFSLKANNTRKQQKRVPKQSQLLAMEKKYQAIFELLHVKYQSDKGQVTNVEAETIARKWGVGSGPRLRSLCRQALNGDSLMAKKGRGRKCTVTNRDDISEFMEEKAAEWKFEFSLELMTQDVYDQFGVGCRSSITNIMDDWTKTKQSVKPFLTESHIESRLTWCQVRENTDFFSARKVCVHLDEKWFYAFRAGRVLYCPPGVEPPEFFALSKTQIPKLMYFGAVAPPNPDKGFDGKIGLWWVCEKKIAQRKGKFHARGEEYEVGTIMDGKKFVEMCIEKLLPAIKEKLKWASEVEVQMDSAGGHKVGTSVDILNDHCKRLRKPSITFVTQPTRSPDLNTLDLGTWNSIQANVPSVKYQRDSEKSIDERIHAEVLKAWKEYDGSRLLHNIYVTLSRVYKQVIEVKGGNVYKLRDKK